MSLNLQIRNPDVFSPLRIFSQSRAREYTVDAPTAAQLPKRHTREELQAQGSKVVMVPSRGTALVDGVMKSVVRDVPTPFYMTAGYESINGFITEVSEKETREFQAAAARAAMLASAGASRGQRVVDEWSTALKPLMLVPPGETRVIHDEDFQEHKRVLIESDGEAGIQIQNESQVRTLRLRNRDSSSGAQTHVAYLAPAQVGLVIANKKSAAVVELLPS
jgi:hypothetical protein